MSEEFDEGSLTVKRDESKVATPASLPMSDIQLRIARENPRNEEEINKRLVKELEANAGYADELFYSIPYKDNRKGLINFVEGPSIRAAEHMWSRWGNCTVAARVADDRGNKIMVQGMFFDYENGLLLLSDLEVSKMGQARGGGTYPLSANDLRIKVAATESKVKRNAFLSGVPVWIRDGYKNMCFDLSMGVSKKTVPERIIDAKVFFMSRFKLEEKAVLELIEKIEVAYPGIDPKSTLRYLIGIKNAVKDGNVDVDFVFGEEKKPAIMPQAKKEPAGAAAKS